jgi:hypothetical protein
MVELRLEVWISVFSREKKLFDWRKGKEVINLFLGMPHLAGLTPKISEMKNNRKARLGELDTAVGLDSTKRCRCQARSRSAVVSRRAGAIRRDHTGTLREAIADWLRASVHPRVTLGVDSSLFSHRRLTWAGKFGDNQGQMCGTSDEQDTYRRNSQKRQPRRLGDLILTRGCLESRFLS